MSDIPEDIVICILSKLSVKSLLRFRCVSKTWRSLIDDPNFVKLHLNEAIRNNKTNLILCNRSYVCSLDYDTQLEQALEIDYPHKILKETSYRSVQISGSCHGLLSIYNHANHTHAIWNPCTREFKTLPPCKFFYEQERGSSVVYGFGYDDHIDDYKVVKIVQYCNMDDHEYWNSKVRVYTLGTDTWHKIQNMYSYISSDDPSVFVNGTLNWLGALGLRRKVDRHIIVSFNVVGEKFRKICCPESVKRNTISLGVLGGNMCLLTCINDIQADLWVMKNYGVRESWIKLFTIPQLTVNEDKSLRVLCFSKTGRILLLHEDTNLVLYNPISESVEIVHTHDTSMGFTADAYAGSLVSLNSGTYVGNELVERKRKIGKMRQNVHVVP